MNNAGKWTYNIHDTETWIDNEFNTKDEAIEAAKIEIEEEGYSCDSFKIGQIEKVDISGVDVDYFLENIVEATTSDLSEVGEDYLSDVTDKDKKELEERLNEVFFEWIKRNRYEPNFFKVENVTEILL